MDIKNKLSYNIGFGWKHKTHKIISEAARSAHDLKIPTGNKIARDILDNSCVEPDISRKLSPSFIRGHFANIDNPDSEAPDAFHLARRYTDQALDESKKASATENPDEIRQHLNRRDRKTGYSLHFVQDPLNPFHVDYHKIPKDHPERVAHTAFEQRGNDFVEDVVQKAKPSKGKPEGSFWRDVFPAAMRESKDQWDRIKSDDYKFTDDDVEQALTRTYQVTDDYMNRMADRFGRNAKPKRKKA